MRWTSKIVHEWNVHLEICIRPQAKENSRQYLLFRTDILQKTVVGTPWFHDLIGDGLNMLLDISAYQQRIVTIQKLKIERSERLISSRLVQDKTELTILKWQLNASRNTWCNTVAGYIIVYVFSIFWLNFQTELLRLFIDRNHTLPFYCPQMLSAREICLYAFSPKWSRSRVFSGLGGELHINKRFTVIFVSIDAIRSFPSLWNGRKYWLNSIKNSCGITNKLCFGDPGGAPGNSWWGCAARFLKSWPDFRPKKM